MYANFQVVLEGELFSICDGLSDASRIGQLLSAGVYLDITDDVCSLIIRVRQVTLVNIIFDKLAKI